MLNKFFFNEIIFYDGYYIKRILTSINRSLMTSAIPWTTTAAQTRYAKYYHEKHDSNRTNHCEKNPAKKINI